MGAVALDASVIIAFLYTPDAQHHAARAALAPWLVPGHSVLVPASVYSEILVGPLRVGAEDIVDRFLGETGSEIVPVDRSIARRAANLRARHSSLRLPDALVLATTHEHAATLLTLDQKLQRIASAYTP